MSLGVCVCVVVVVVVVVRVCACWEVEMGDCVVVNDLVKH